MRDVKSMEEWELTSSINADIAAHPTAHAEAQDVLKKTMPTPVASEQLQGAMDLMVVAMVSGQADTVAKAEELLTRMYMDEEVIGEHAANELMRKWKGQAAQAIEKVHGRKVE